MHRQTVELRLLGAAGRPAGPMGTQRAGLAATRTRAPRTEAELWTELVDRKTDEALTVW
jgi:hypothetical protein